jgi:hypothetical protein
MASRTLRVWGALAWNSRIRNWELFTGLAKAPVMETAPPLSSASQGGNPASLPKVLLGTKEQGCSHILYTQPG